MSFVFIIIRHINSIETNQYWLECYNCIRQHHPTTEIIIIDDNSDPKYIDNLGYTFDNVEFVQSEFPKRGELLPYYYFYKNKYADNAVILHDSVFIQHKIDFENAKVDIKFLWHHIHTWDDEANETRLINTLDNSDELLKLYEKKDDWVLCVGVMSFISHKFISQLQDKYKIFNLLHHVSSRNDRMCLERIFGLLCIALLPEINKGPSIFGIQNRWGYSYESYKYDKSFSQSLPVYTKVWTGR
jgi:hypothetical protein